MFAGYSGRKGKVFAMQKGKTGLTLTFYAVLAFAAAFFGGVTASLLVAGFVIIVEKNDWLTKQSLEAVFLTMSISLLSFLFNHCETWLKDMIGWFDPYSYGGDAYGILTNIFSFFAFVITVLEVVLTIIAISRVCKGKNAGLPILDDLANRALGIFRPKPVVPSPMAPAAPTQAAAPAPAPQQPAAPAAAQPAAPAEPQAPEQQ